MLPLAHHIHGVSVALIVVSNTGKQHTCGKCQNYGFQRCWRPLLAG